jgi:hypothetical protein
MKKPMILLILGVLVCSGGTWLSGEQENKLIPQDILKFYRDYNFVCAFTTPSERMRLVSCLEEGILPDELDNQRYQEIFSCMKRLIAQVLIIDPDMVLPPGVGKDMQKVVFRPELFEVPSYRRIKDGAGIDVIAYAMRPEMTARYISGYEDNQGDASKLPTEAQILEEAGSRIEQRRETHSWKYINGRWLKTFGSYIFLKK